MRAIESRGPRRWGLTSEEGRRARQSPHHRDSAEQSSAARRRLPTKHGRTWKQGVETSKHKRQRRGGTNSAQHGDIQVEEDAEEDRTSEEKRAADQPPPPPSRTPEQRVAAAQASVADIAHSVLANPEGHIASLGKLLDMARGVTAKPVSGAGEETGHDGDTGEGDGAANAARKPRKRRPRRGDSTSDAPPILPVDEADRIIRQMALISLVEVFRDILPDYRIILHGDKATADGGQHAYQKGRPGGGGGGKPQQESKDVKKRTRYERTLLSQYTKFVKHLILVSSTRKLAAKKHRQYNRQERTIGAFGLVVYRCLCRLLERGYSFNLRKELLHVVVPSLNHWSHDVRSLTLSTVSTLFRNDVAGDAVLEAVTIMVGVVRRAGVSVHEEVLLSFLELRLERSVLEEGARVAEEQKVSRKKRKREYKLAQKKAKAAADLARASGGRRSSSIRGPVLTVEDQKRIDADIAAGQVDHDIVHRQRIQAAILTHLFTMYFRILKESIAAMAARDDVSATEDTSGRGLVYSLRHNSVVILPYVLRGLSRYARLINFELVTGMVQCLKELLAASADRRRRSLDGADEQEEITSGTSGLPLESLLHCAVTVFAIAHKAGTSVSVDLHEMYSFVFSSMWGVVEEQNHVHVPLLLQCMDLMFFRTKQLATARVAGFAKRLILISMHLPANGGTAVLHTVHQLLRKYTRVGALLDFESAGSGVSDPLAEDPDFSNAMATTAWELPLLQSSPLPVLISRARSVGLYDIVSTIDSTETGTPLAKFTPAELYGAYGAEALIMKGSLFKQPTLKTPCVNPLELAAAEMADEDDDEDGFKEVPAKQRKKRSKAFLKALAERRREMRRAAVSETFSPWLARVHAVVSGCGSK